MSLDKSIELIAENKFQEAKEILEKITLKEPSNFDALKNLGLCYVNLEEFELALKAFLQAVAVKSDDATSYFYIATIYDRLQDFDNAEKYYKKVLSIRPEHIDTYKNLALLSFRNDDFNVAIEILNKAIEFETGDFELYYMLSSCFMTNGDIDSALKNLNIARELEPTSAQIINSIGSCYLKLNDTKKALEYFEQAFEIDPYDPIANFNIGLIYDAEGDHARAFNYFEEAYKKMPIENILAAYANCAYLCKKIPLATQLFSTLVAIRPDVIKYQRNLMLSLELMHDYKNALIIADNLLKHNPKDDILLRKLATLNRCAGNYEVAIRTFEILMKKGKFDSDSFWELGVCYVKLDEKDNALNAFKNAIKLESDNAIAHKDLALLYLRLNLLDWAEEEISEALKISPDDFEINFGAGVLYFTIGKYDLADKCFAHVADCAEVDSLFNASYAQNLLSLGQVEPAVLLFKKALSADPKCEIALYELAKHYFAEKKYSPAKNLVEELLMINPDSEYEYLLAKINMATNNHKKAILTLLKLTELFPQNHLILLDLALSYFETNDFENAKKYIKASLTIYPDFEEGLDLLKKLENENDK